MFARCRGSRTRTSGDARSGAVVTPLARRIRAIADAARRWEDADFPTRVRATRALVERTGYTEPVVEYALDALFGSITAAALGDTIAGEIGSLDALDAFVARPGRPGVRYVARERVAIVSSDTTIGVAIPALVFALCAGCDVIVKDRTDRLVNAFAETLAEELPEFATRVMAFSWDGADEVASRAQLADMDVVVAYGRTRTLAAIRGLLRPDARFVPYGHRTSVGYVSTRSLADERDATSVALGAARDALLYDGDGCLSLHVLFVESGAVIDPRAFARALSEACDRTAVEFPAGYAELDPAAAAYRRTALFRASQGEGAAFTGIVAPHLVVLDPPRDEPPPLLRRTIAVYSVAGPDHALAFLRQHALALEAIAFDGVSPRDDLIALAAASGASRITLLGELQRPPLAAEHGGVGRILPFVRAIYRA
jgi:hypothetical protein